MDQQYVPEGTLRQHYGPTDAAARLIRKRREALEKQKPGGTRYERWPAFPMKGVLARGLRM